jgi:5-methylcytosine-specific restriction protein B
MPDLTSHDTPDNELMALLPHATSGTRRPTLATVPATGETQVEAFTLEDPLSPGEDLPLEVPSYTDLVEKLISEMSNAGLLLPDVRGLAERLVSAVLAGHVVLQGPPGTGKTTIARILADVFGCTSDLETATADWSTFDIIGGFVPASDSNGREVLRPWLGHVTRAAEECSRLVRASLEDDSTPQAHWLIIDEFSRAEMDKAIGPLYSALGNTSERSVHLWFMPGARSHVLLPRRFRLIGTMNDVDASFVYGFSKGLGRRFEFVEVGVPAENQIADEFTAAQAAAAAWTCNEYPGLASDDPRILSSKLEADASYMAECAKLRELFVFLRAKPVSCQLGTAQLIDVLKGVMVTSPRDVRSFDNSISGRLVPQLSTIARSDQTAVVESLRNWGWIHAAVTAERMFGSHRSI